MACLDTLINMKELLDLRPGHWNLHILPRAYVANVLEACGYLARSGPLWVLDCNRQYNPSLVLRAALGRADFLNNIHSQRAFNCFEVSRLMQITKPGKMPVVILDPITSFYDENVQYRMRQFLLGNCITNFHRLCNGAGMAIFVQRPPGDSEAINLFNRLEHASQQALTYELFVNQVKQAEMF